MSRCVIIGDSQTKYFKEYLKPSHQLQVTVDSVSGRKVQDLNSNSINHVEGYDHIIVHLGTNNLISEGAATVAKKMERLIVEMKTKNPSASIYVSSVLPRAVSNFSGIKMPHCKIDSINEKAATVNLLYEVLLTRLECCFYIDNDLYFRPGDVVNRDLLSRDGLHLAPAGIQQLLRNMLSSLILTPQPAVLPPCPPPSAFLPLPSVSLTSSVSSSSSSSLVYTSQSSLSYRDALLLPPANPITPYSSPKLPICPKLQCPIYCKPSVLIRLKPVFNPAPPKPSPFSWQPVRPFKSRPSSSAFISSSQHVCPSPSRKLKSSFSGLGSLPTKSIRSSGLSSLPSTSVRSPSGLSSLPSKPIHSSRVSSFPSKPMHSSSRLSSLPSASIRSPFRLSSLSSSKPIRTSSRLSSLPFEPIRFSSALSSVPLKSIRSFSYHDSLLPKRASSMFTSPSDHPSSSLYSSSQHIPSFRARKLGSCTPSETCNPSPRYQPFAKKNVPTFQNLKLRNRYTILSNQCPTTESLDIRQISFPPHRPVNGGGSDVLYPRQCEKCNNFYKTKQSFCNHKKRCTESSSANANDENGNKSDVMNECPELTSNTGVGKESSLSVWYPRLCDKCGSFYQTKQSFCYHKIKCTGVGKESSLSVGYLRLCDKCGSFYQTKQSFCNHKIKCTGSSSDNKAVKTCQSNKPYPETSLKCGKFNVSTQFSDHFKEWCTSGAGLAAVEAKIPSELVKNKLMCTICQKNFKHRQGLYKHKKLHLIGKMKRSMYPRKCTVCSHRYLSKSSFCHHKRYCNKLKSKPPSVTTYPRSCPTCSLMFSLPTTFYKHRAVCSAGVASVSCSFTGCDMELFSVKIDNVVQADHSYSGAQIRNLSPKKDFDAVFNLMVHRLRTLFKSKDSSDQTRIIEALETVMNSFESEKDKLNDSSEIPSMSCTFAPNQKSPLQPKMFKAVKKRPASCLLSFEKPDESEIRDLKDDSLDDDAILCEQSSTSASCVSDQFAPKSRRMSSKSFTEPIYNIAAINSLYNIDNFYVSCLELKSLDMFISAEEEKQLQRVNNEFVRGWLFDSVIDIFIHALLSENEGTCQITSDYVQVATSTKDVTKCVERFPPVDYYSYDNILIPCCLNRNHWVLIVVKVQENKLLFFDPYTVNIEKGHFNLLSKWKKILNILLHKNDFDWGQPFSPPHILQPCSDRNNCGPYICYYIYKILKNEVPDAHFETDMFRKYMYDTIMSHIPKSQ